MCSFFPFLCGGTIFLQPDDLTSLVVVILYDLQDRKFEPRYNTDDEEPIAEVQEVENYLYRYNISQKTPHIDALHETSFDL